MKQMLKKCVIGFNFIPVCTMNKLQKAINICFCLCPVVTGSEKYLPAGLRLLGFQGLLSCVMAALAENLN